MCEVSLIMKLLVDIIYDKKYLLCNNNRIDV